MKEATEAFKVEQEKIIEERKKKEEQQKLLGEASTLDGKLADVIDEIKENEPSVTMGH